jgi:Zn-dependent peptidase ImmA (M78 family)
VNVPDLSGKSPELAASILRATWGLGQEPISNVVHLLESHGVWVFSLAEETANVDAFSVWRGNSPYVFLNTQKSGEHSRLDAAHELGHLVLHRREKEPRGRECEREAQQFGAAFLMPREGIIATTPLRPSLHDLVEAKRPWRVSVAALLYRIDSLGLLSEWHSRQLWIDLSKAGYRRREPRGVSQETSQLLGKVFAALRREGVSRADVATALGVYAVDLNALIFGLVVTSAEGRSLSEAPDTASRLGARVQLRSVK